LYHSDVRRPFARAIASCAPGLACALVLAAAVTISAGAPDRLDRFRELAASRLNAAQLGPVDAEALREVYALLDAEIVDSLTSGGVFASREFLQERLDGFTEAWGAAFLDITRLNRLVVGAFHLADAPGANSVRVFGRVGREAALLAALQHDARPRLYPLPPRADGAAQFVVAWEGALSGHGTRSLRLDLVREEPDGVRVVWSTADTIGETLMARSWTVRGGEIAVRYEVRYPGWTPGCEGQTEQEDVYRFSTASGTFVRAARREHNAWHRALRDAAARFFAALAAGDRTALAAFVPDPALREQLPATLSAEPACDAPDGGTAASVSVAAVADGQRPWALTWQRAGAQWRLVAAAPVLQ